VDLTARFAELVHRPEEDLPLDEPALLIAAHDHPVDIDAQLRALDDLAASVGANDASSLAHALFVERGFAGNTVDYGDPRNSFLDEVMRRRLGLPITLSVLMIEIGRRRGISCTGVGMPGHFLVGADEGFLDPFHGGTLLDAAGARRLFERANPGAPFFEHYLDPVGARAVLARMLANLVATYLARDPMRAVWALRLRLTIPGIPEVERRQAEEALRHLRARLN
jgi:regulator of sirC expression with transglutaminase-like and TPR domain